MKKLLLSLIASVSALIPMAASHSPEHVADHDCISSAFSFESANAYYHKSHQQKVESRADAGYDLRFCGNLYTWYRTVNGSNYTYRVYLAITADMATQLAGNEITDITFSPYLKSGRKQATVFVSESLDADPIVAASKNVTNGVEVTVDFDTPYVIKEGVPFYFGYTIAGCNDRDYPVGIDEGPANEYCGFVETTKNGSSETISASELGYNVFLYAHTTGEKEGLTNVFSVGNLTAGEVSHPVVTNCGHASLYLPIYNYGVNAIESIKYTVNGDETFELGVEVAGCSSEMVSMPVGAIEPGDAKVTVKVEAINDIAGDYPASTAEFMAIAGNGFTRRFVVEELTGAWCGWCPMGIVGFEYMSENYPDEFIGIAVHSGDTMAVSSYATLDNTMGREMGYPSCWANRDPMYYFQPAAENLQIVYDNWSTQRAIAKVYLELYYYEGVLTAATHTKFDLDIDNANYALAFVILEDGYTDKQSNYFAGGGSGEMGGWEDMKSNVDWTYSHVARDIFTYKGLSESVPQSIVAGESYRYEYELDLRNVQDVAKTTVVAMLLNTSTGEIVNAAKVKADDYLLTGVSNAISDKFSVKGGDGQIIIDSDNEIATVYNIAGQKVATTRGKQAIQLNAGIYIVRVGDNSQKVIVK